MPKHTLGRALARTHLEPFRRPILLGSNHSRVPAADQAERGEHMRFAIERLVEVDVVPGSARQ